jgi:hypothetical protein
MIPRRQKDETLRTLVDLTEAAARQQLSVMLFEDAHWADPITLEVLDLLIDRVKTVPLLMMLTHRPEFQSRWSEQGHVGALNLSKLTRTQSAAMVCALAGGKALPAALLDQILTRTDGVPLFVEELTKSILESGELKEAGDHYDYAGSAPAVTSLERAHNAAGLDVPKGSYTGAPISNVDGDRVATDCSRWKPASANSAVNSDNVRSRPPVITSIVMSLRLISLRLGLVNNRSMTINRPEVPMPDRQARRMAQTFASSSSISTFFTIYASPPAGTALNMSPPTVWQRSATPCACSTAGAPATTWGKSNKMPLAVG